MNMHTLIPLLIAAGTVLGVATGRRFFVVIRVVGSSMLPSFHPHDRVLVRRIAGRKIAVGAVAVLAEPLDVRSWRLSPVATPRLAGTTWVIKRVAAVPGDTVPEPVRNTFPGTAVVPDGMLVVLSDNPEGTDSRHWGFVPAGSVLGSVVLKIPARCTR